MTKKQFSELKAGEKITFFGEIFVVKKIELSEKGLKRGRRKCRVEVKNKETGEEKIMIRLANEPVETI
jgi:translation elongation factor P/translation initiation factor 5A